VALRRRKHRGKKAIDIPMSIEKIENRFDKQLEEKQLSSELFMAGSKIPTLRSTRIYDGNQELKTCLQGSVESNNR